MRSPSSAWQVTAQRRITQTASWTEHWEFRPASLEPGNRRVWKGCVMHPGSLLAGLLAPIFLYWIYGTEISFPSHLSHTQERFLSPQCTGLSGGVTRDRCEVLCEFQSGRAGGKPALCPAAPPPPAGRRFVIHESSYFPRRPKFSMTITWRFSNSTWKQPKPIACSFYT